MNYGEGAGEGEMDKGGRLETREEAWLRGKGARRSLPGQGSSEPGGHEEQKAGAEDEELREGA